MEIDMVSPEFFMLLQLTNILKGKAIDAAEMSDNDLHIIWVAYKNMFEFWAVAHQYNVAPPPIH